VFQKTSLRFLVNASANVNRFQNAFTGKFPRKFLFISDRDFHVASIALLNHLVKFKNSKPPNLYSYHQNLFTRNLTNNIQIIHATKNRSDDLLNFCILYRMQITTLKYAYGFTANSIKFMQCSNNFITHFSVVSSLHFQQYAQNP